jgi:murein DD-endopeptidase MepM/ murein hydrolase activator NlpD
LTGQDGRRTQIPKDEYVFLVIPPGGAKTLRFGLRPWLLKILAALAILTVSGLLVGLALYGRIAAQAQRVAAMQDEVVTLQRKLREVDRMLGELEALDRTRQKLLAMMGVEEGGLSDTPSGSGERGVLAAQDPAVGPASSGAGRPLADKIRFVPARGPVSRGYIGSGAKAHEGTDIAGKVGTPVVAAGAGRVVRAEVDPVFGNVVVIDHGGGVETLYGHNERLLVQAGDWVEAGQQIAEMGSTGMSSAPHLHFEIHVGGKSIDPATVFPELGGPEE